MVDPQAAQTGAPIARGPTRQAGRGPVIGGGDPRTPRLTAAGILLVLAACGEPIDSTSAPIVGGTVSIADPAVVALERCFNGSCTVCTATLVSRQTLLTASHCVDQNIEAGAVDGLVGFFGTSVNDPGTRIQADDAEMHRYYDVGTLQFDVAMVHLSEPAPDTIPEVVLNDQPLDDSFIGQPIRLVGYGETEFGRNDFGLKHEVVTTITSVAPQHLFTGTDTENSCKGDSGGPTFHDDGSGEVQIGITSRSVACQASSVKIRVDVFLDEFIHPYIDKFEGPCALDGTCSAANCRSPDPDCDPCLWDGTCATGCTAPDWDCPIGLNIGAECTDREQCEFKLCQVATDDERVTYCSRPCDPARPQPDCLDGMECADDGDGPRCVWPEPTPRVLGSACGISDNCRSGLCEDGVCVERCDEVPGGGPCEAPFECRASDLGGQVCGPPLADAGGCGCRSSAGNGNAVTVLLLLSALAAIRRRRSSSIA